MKKVLNLLLLILCGTTILFAQSESIGIEGQEVWPSEIAKEAPKQEVFTIVEVMPVFGDCDESIKEPSACTDENLKTFLNDELKKYKFENTGKVYVRFVIDANGNLIDEEIAKSPSEDLSKIALDIVRKMQNWKPGTQHGQAISV